MLILFDVTLESVVGRTCVARKFGTYAQGRALGTWGGGDVGEIGRSKEGGGGGRYEPQGTEYDIKL